MNELLNKFVKDIKGVWYIPAAIVVGVILMVFQVDTTESVPVSNSQSINYSESMELCVEEMLKSIPGAENSVVTITLADFGRREYVREDGDVLVVKDEQGNQTAVVANERVPTIAGVTVTCSDAGSASFRRQVIQAVSTLLGIGTNKVCVVSIGG